MATYTKVKLSGSGAGLGNIPVTTGSGAIAIHTTGTSTTILDEVWLWCHNPGGGGISYVSLYIYNSSGEIQIYAIPEYSTMLILPGLPLSGTGSSVTTIELQTVSGGSSYAYGYVNRITP